MTNKISATTSNGRPLIRDGSLVSFSVDLAGHPSTCTIVIQPRRSTQAAAVQLTFTQLMMIDLGANTDDLGGPDIERLKFLDFGDSIYFSLDPFDEFSQVTDPRDAFVLQAKSYELVQLPLPT